MKKMILLFCVEFIFLTAFPQSNVVEFLKAGKSDANALD